MDEFFKKAFKKIKKAVKKGVKIAKKVGKVIGKLSPIRFVLNKLRKLARPLLKRVLKFALNKLPPQFRPIAKKIGDKIIKGVAGETEDTSTLEALEAFDNVYELQIASAADPSSAAVPASTLATELDAMLVSYLLEGEAFEESQYAVEYLTSSDLENAATIDLDQARDQFVQLIRQAEDGQDIEPEVEQFVTAILAGAKIAIKIIGRKRVVKFLAKIIARLIRRFVGRQMAMPLSRALADAGLRLLRLEDQDDQRLAVAELLAGTVEDTVERMLDEIPFDIESEQELELYAAEAFEASVRDHFPATYLREDLQDEAPKRGVWQLRARRPRTRRYKKYTQTISVKITPAMAKKVLTFGGRSLANEIGGGTVEARLHLFEIMRGTRLTDIAALEKDVQGLGRATKAAVGGFHPLSCHAAAVLLPHQHKLCRDVDKKYLQTRRRLKVGQRLYYLEVKGGTTRPTGGGAMSSRVSAHLDFARRQVNVVAYLSEADSQTAARAIKEGKNAKHYLSLVRGLLKGQLPAVLGSMLSRQLTLSKEAGESEAFIGKVGNVLKNVGPQISKALLQKFTRALLGQLKKGQLADSLVKAANHPAQGVSITFTLSSVPEIFAVLKGDLAERVKALSVLSAGTFKGQLAIAIKPGYHPAKGS